MQDLLQNAGSNNFNIVTTGTNTRASEASEERPPKNISNPADRDRIRIRDYVLITRTGATTQHPPHGSPREPFVVQER